MSDYEFSMPWPPTVNHWHQPCRNRVIKGAKAREYEKLAVKHLIDIGLFGEHINSEMSVRLELMPPTNSRYDIDNRTKGVFDSLSAADFWVDDSLVTKLVIEKREKVAGGLVNVFVNVIKRDTDQV